MAEEKNSKAELRNHAYGASHQQEASTSSRSCSLEMLLRRLRSMDDKQEDNFASILDAVGEFGLFQRRLVALTFIPNILSAFFTSVDHFVLTDQVPYCNTSWILAVGPNLSEAEQLNLTLPRAPNGSFLTCLMYLPVPWDLESIIQFGLNNTDTCEDGWIYPYSKKRSLINEFDMVCGNEPSEEIMRATYMAGILTGSLVLGFVTDRLGRYPTILISLFGLLVFGFGTAFVNSFHQYLFFRFIVSQAVVGYVISSVALATEWLVGKHRAHAVVLEHCFSAVGLMFLTSLAYTLPHWRLLFLLGGMPVFPLISYIWIVPESPRWLMTKGRMEEAKQVLCHAASVNKRTIPFHLLDELQLHGKRVAKASVLDFYSNRHLFRVTLVMGCVWFTVSYSYYTLSLKMKDSGINIYFRKAVPGIMEVPARLCCIFLLEQIGRKWSLVLSLLQVTVMSLLLLFLPQELKSTMVLVLVLREFSLAATITVFFLYTAELLPTVLRATGLGLVSLTWAAGAILSLTIISQLSSRLPLFLCCLSSIVALCCSFMVPETQNQPLCDSLEHFSKASFQKEILQHAEDFFRRSSKDTTAATMSEDSMSDDVTEEAAKNTILNTWMLSADTELPSSTAWAERGDREAHSSAA